MVAVNLLGYILFRFETILYCILKPHGLNALTQNAFNSFTIFALIISCDIEVWYLMQFYLSINERYTDKKVIRKSDIKTICPY